MDNFFNNTNLIRLYKKWKWHLLIIIAFAAILGVIISCPVFIKPKYKSFAVLYPVNLIAYSGESQTEQMIQWLNSRDIMASMIIKYDLARHYDINPSRSHFHTLMQKTYEKNVLISKTKFESVCLEVMDTDPVKARDMVYSVIDLYNNKVNASHREKYLEVLQLEEKRLVGKKQQLDSLKNIIVRLRETYGLMDYGIQASEVTKGLLGTFDGGDMNHVNINEAKRLKENIQSKGDSLLLLTNLMSAATSAYTNWLVSYEAARLNVEKELTFATYVTHPVIADKKSYPVRWLILIYSVFPALFLVALLIAVIEKNKNISG